MVYIHFTVEQEKESVELILTFSWAGFPLSKKVRSLAYQYPHVNKIKGFSKVKKEGGRDILKGFLNCNPEVRIKKVHNPTTGLVL